METFILKNLEDNITAVLDCNVKYDCIKLSYSIKALTGGIYKLIALSSLKPSCEPVAVDTPEFKNSFAQGVKELTPSEAAYRGYYLDDIDTFVLARKEPYGFLPVAVHFCRLAWDFGANKFFLSSKADAPNLKRAKNVLESIKTPPCDAVYEEYISKVNSFKKCFKKSHLLPLEGFLWYEADDKSWFDDIPAYSHALSQLDNKSGFLWGVGANSITAIAVDEKINFSFPNVSDCVVKNNNYCIVGVWFKEDGQYFVRLLG